MARQRTHTTLTKVAVEKAFRLGDGATDFVRMVKYVANLNPASVAAGTTAEQTFTVNGLATNDVILAVEKPTVTAGLGIVGARVSAANTLAITFANVTAGAIDPGAENYTIIALRS